MIKLIALDLDGTLAIEDHQVSTLTRDALDNLHRNGVEVVIATGRRYRTTRYVIENLGFDVFAVCNGGALIKAPDQTTLYRESFSVIPILEITRELKLTLFAQRDSHHHGGADFIIDSVTIWNEVTGRHADQNQDWCEVRDLTTSSNDYMVAGCFGHQRELNLLANQIVNKYGNNYNTIIVPHIDSHWFYCEISLGHVDKWHGLQKILSSFNLAPENVCAVGDQLNDLSMVTGAGHGVAMANGHKQLRAAANFVCGHHERDGLLDVIRYIEQHNKNRL